ncbi:hypothetical protein DO70_3598 [Burkholderia pseudomallei]|nr:hypothetical protein DO70_3598 [Burkholderia pseudomallei]KGD30738.1 hypothetical protein DP59_5402 [Burkholderia pseudomallei]
MRVTPSKTYASRSMQNGSFRQRSSSPWQALKNSEAIFSWASSPRPSHRCWRPVRKVRFDLAAATLGCYPANV